ncbi:hypothetical protein IAT38_006457 [Cryptococcus sp. DSM 104549]
MVDMSEGHPTEGYDATFLTERAPTSFRITYNHLPTEALPTPSSSRSISVGDDGEWAREGTVPYTYKGIGWSLKIDPRGKAASKTEDDDEGESKRMTATYQSKIRDTDVKTVDLVSGVGTVIGPLTITRLEDTDRFTATGFGGMERGGKMKTTVAGRATYEFDEHDYSVTVQMEDGGYLKKWGLEGWDQESLGSGQWAQRYEAS